MLQITFRHMLSAESVRTIVEQKLDKLRAYVHGPAHCHVVVEHRPCCTRRYEQYRARAELKTGGQPRLDVSATHEHAGAAVRAAFELLERRLAGRTERAAAQVA